MIILLMGVEGAGKTTVGQLLAGAIGWRFEYADNYHSAHNIAKMKAGIPLSDEDRKPWLDKLHEVIGVWRSAGENVVLACSALKKSYRDLLISGPDVKLVYLSGPYALILQRLVARHGHYAHADLLRSQFETLEQPENAVVIDVSGSPESIVMEIRKRLNI